VQTPSWGQKWHHLPSCFSTNDEAQRLGRAGASEGTVVTASEQTGGRGRLGRRWHSPPDENLYFSLLLRPPLPPPRAPLLCLCAGLALHQAARATLAEAAGSEPSCLRLKWPNDLLGAEPGAPYRKLGGVLTELVCVGSAIDFVVVGIGCNVNSTAFPSELAATSLRLLLGRAQDQPQLDVRPLAERLLAAMADWYGRYLADGPAPIVEAFASAAALGPQHPPIRVESWQGGFKQGASAVAISGVPIGLGENGELLVRSESGAIKTVLSGDVSLASQALPEKVA